MSPFHSLTTALNTLSSSQLLLISVLSIPVLYILKRTFFPSTSSSTSSQSLDEDEDEPSETEGSGNKSTTTSVMAPENSELDPPKDTPFRLEELKQFDGSDPSKPIYVAIKGTIFDVSKKREMYGPGKSYNIFAGKDGSRGLGMSSLKEDDAVPDYTTLPPNEMKVLDDWYSFFSKRYNVVGRVVDLPDAVTNANL